MNPLVSIPIPACIVGPWIADTNRSAAVQTWPHKEIIVIDDGSKDDTVTIGRQFESADLKVVSKRNEGAAATRNHAFTRWKHRWLAPIVGHEHAWRAQLALLYEMSRMRAAWESARRNHCHGSDIPVHVAAVDG